MHDNTELIRMQTPCCLISTGHIGNKCEKLDLKNQGYGSASESEQGHPWGWAAFLMADVLRTRAHVFCLCLKRCSWRLAGTRFTVQPLLMHPHHESVSPCLGPASVVLRHLPHQLCTALHPWSCTLLPWSHHHHPVSLHVPLRAPTPMRGLHCTTAVGSRKQRWTQDFHNLVHTPHVPQSYSKSYL